jgi:integrase
MAKSKKRADGLYQKNIVIGRNADGSYKRKTVYGKTQKELEEQIAEVKSQLKMGIRIDDDSTFRELSEVWINNYRSTMNTTWAYQQERYLNLHILPYIGDIKVKKLTKFDMQSCINGMREGGYSTSTMKKVRNIAAQILQVAMDKKVVIENPFKSIAVTEIPPKDRRPLTEEEIDLITKTWSGHKMGYAAMMMLYCGLRRGEVLALDWSDVDLKNKVVKITKAITFLSNQPIMKGPKSKAGIRDVPIPDFLVEIFKSIVKNSPVFLPNAQGERMSDMAYFRAWDSYEAYLNIKAGGHGAVGGKRKVVVLDHITAHMLRHTYASLLYDAGVDIKSAQRYLGHSDIETTLEIYTHLTKHKEDEAVQSINKHFEERFIRKKQRNDDDRER